MTLTAWAAMAEMAHTTKPWGLRKARAAVAFSLLSRKVGGAASPVTRARFLDPVGFPKWQTCRHQPCADSHGVYPNSTKTRAPSRRARGVLSLSVNLTLHKFFVAWPDIPAGFAGRAVPVRTHRGRPVSFGCRPTLVMRLAPARTIASAGPELGNFAEFGVSPSRMREPT